MDTNSMFRGLVGILFGLWWFVLGISPGLKTAWMEDAYRAGCLALAIISWYGSLIALGVVPWPFC